MIRYLLKGRSTDQRRVWGSFKKWGTFKSFLLTLAGFLLMILIQQVLFHSKFVALNGISIVEIRRREFGLPQRAFDKKVIGARVMARQESIWHWGEINSFDGTRFTIILDYEHLELRNLHTDDIKTELEASSWLTDLYLNSVKKSRVDKTLPNIDECGFKPRSLFSWISGAPRPLHKTRHVNSHVMARRVDGRKWYWAKILQVLESQECMVQFENGDIVKRIPISDLLTELEASSWLMDSYSSSSKIVVDGQLLGQIPLQINDKILDVKRDFDLSKLWVGGVSKYPKTSFVISVCLHDLDWLPNFVTGYQIHKITIITKCGTTWDVDTLPEAVTVIELPNIGRHDHSYAYYLAYVHERSIDNDEVVFFLKGDVSIRQSARSRSLDRMMRVINERGFACFEEPPSGLSAFYETGAYAAFTTTNNSRFEKDTEESFKSPLYSNLGDYAKALSITLHTPLIPVCYGGNFAAGSLQISKWSQNLWANIERSLSRANDIEETHFQQLLWAGILSEALSSEESQILLNEAELVDPSEHNRDFVGSLFRKSEGNGLAHDVAASSTFIVQEDPLPQANIDSYNEGDAQILVFYNLFVMNDAEMIEKEKLASEQMSLLGPEHKLHHVDSFGVPINLTTDAAVFTQHKKKYAKTETMHSLWQYCRNHTSDKVVYLHTNTKEEFKEVAMMASRGALSNECATLPSSCNVCSTRMNPLPHPQIPYNMWLARCDYVARLIDPYIFTKSMSKVAPNKGFCRGVGKYAPGHWIYSHPSILPCDLHPSPKFIHKEEFRQQSENFKMDLQPAPRFQIAVYRKEEKQKYCVGHGETLDERINEYDTLYGERPYSSWWGWTFFNTKLQAPQAISYFPSTAEQVKAGSSTSIDYEMLWLGGVSEYTAISIVISFCSENLNWLTDFAGGYKIHKITILSKCNLTWKHDALPEDVIFIDLPNVGRCDHSYAYWMANMYEPHTHKDEVIFFLKDNIGVRRPARARSIDSMIRSTNEVGFACFEEPMEGFSVFHETSTLQTFELSGYSRLERDSGTSFKNPAFKTLRDYDKTLNISLPMPLTPVCYGGNFAVRGSQISKRSKDFWQNLEYALTRADNIEEGHFQERSWAGILTKPLDAGVARMVLREGEVRMLPPFSGTLSIMERHNIATSVSEATPVSKFLYKLSLALPTIGNDTKEGETSVANYEKIDEGSKRISIFYNLHVPDAIHIEPTQILMSEQIPIFRPEHVIYHVDLTGIKSSPPDNIFFRHYEHSSEEATLQSLWQYCLKNRNENVIYLHNDRPYATEGNNFFASGALSSECANLPDNCNLCGTRMNPIPHPQFLGNMWLARCDYVALLMDPIVFGNEMKRIAPSTGYCRGVGFFAGSHWINSHPAAKPCDLHSSPSFLASRDIQLVSSNIDYEPKLESAPRFDLLSYAKRSERNCQHAGKTIEERLDEYNEIYDIAPCESWWGWEFYGTPYNNSTYNSS